MLFVLCSMRHHSSNIFGIVKIATLTTSRIAIDMDIVGVIQVTNNRFLLSRHMISFHNAEGGGETIGENVFSVPREEVGDPLQGKPYSSISLASIQSSQLGNFLF